MKNDYFYVYPCIEDIFIIPLNERNLSKSLTIFLFAHRIIPLIPLEPPIVKLSNTFVFTNLNNDEMVKVEFNTTDKKLIAKSTGNNYGGVG